MLMALNLFTQNFRKVKKLDYLFDTTVVRLLRVLFL